MPRLAHQDQPTESYQSSTMAIPEARAARAIDAGRRLRVGVVGLGKQAQEDHLPAVAASDLAGLVAVCDVDQTSVDQVVDEYGVPGYGDVNDMLAAESLDFVVVAVPHHAGGEVIRAAAARRVHVLKEKPFAPTLGEARELAAVCEEGGIELMVTLQRRFNPVYTSFLQLFDQIGRPFLIDAAYTMSVDPSSGWRGQSRLAGGGCIIDMGYHLVDMLLWYFGMPDRVLAQYSASARPEQHYDAEDTASIAFGFESGLFGHALLSRCVAPKTETIRAIGTRGAVVLERGRVRRLSPDGDVVESLAREQSWPSAARAQVDHFCRILRGERFNTSGPANHLAHAAFIEACYASATSRGFVNPKELIA
ncbi:Gfo/Idh/MocA family protein [Saccharopolyspora sp. NPDC003752]